MLSEVKDYWKDLYKKLFNTKETGVETLEDFNLAIKFCLEEHNKQGEDLEMIYRGESKLYPTFLSPNIVRFENNFIPYQKNSHITEIEVKLIRKFQDTAKRSEILRKLEIYSVDWLYLTQHYESSTRLLDITYSRMVALYFACEKNFQNDAFVFIVLVRGLGPNARQVDSFLEIFEKQTGIIFDYNTPQFLNFENKILDDEVYIRIKNQEAGFIWWHPLNGKLTKNKYFPVLINHKYKKKILSELDSTHRINHNFLFPD